MELLPGVRPAGVIGAKLGIGAVRKGQAEFRRDFTAKAEKSSLKTLSLVPLKDAFERANNLLTDGSSVASVRCSMKLIHPDAVKSSSAFWMTPR